MKSFLFVLVQIFAIALSVQGSGRTVSVAPVPIGMFSMQVPCGETGALVNELSSRYGEKVAYKGAAKSGLMKFYVNPSTLTFTIALEAGGTMCLVLTGKYLTKENSGVPL